VAAESRAGIESLIAKRLSFGGINHFENINTHAIAELFELVYQRDVYASIDVFEELCHFGGSRRRDRDGAIEDAAIEGRGESRGRGFKTADHLGNITTGYRVIAGVLTLRRESYVEAAVAGFANRTKSARIARLENGD